MNDLNFPQDSDTFALSPEDVAKRVGLSRGMVYKAMKKGTLTSSKIGTRRIITVQAVKEWLVACQSPLTQEG